MQVQEFVDPDLVGHEVVVSGRNEQQVGVVLDTTDDSLVLRSHASAFDEPTVAMIPFVEIQSITASQDSFSLKRTILAILVFGAGTAWLIAYGRGVEAAGS